MSLPKFRFKVTGKSVAPNLRGDEMRKLTLEAVPSEAFQSEADVEREQAHRDATAEKPSSLPTPAPPVGRIDVLVNAAFAKQFDFGDEFDLIPREV